jgi:large subunit ribosomal protein L23
MTVEMESPFDWPEEPEDYTAWNKEQNKMAKLEQEEQQERMSGTADAISVSHERRTRMREQARALLEGREQWRPGTSKSTGLLGER